MTQFNIDNTKFYKIVPSSNDGYQLFEQVNLSDSKVRNNMREDFIRNKNHYYLTTNLTEKFVQEPKYRSEYDIMMMKTYQD